MHLSAPDASSSSGQCKLQPLEICLTESIHLYTFSKSLLFQLHADLQPEALAPLKQRFDFIFRRLSEFQTNTTKWTREFIGIQQLPRDPPDFKMVHSPKYCPIDQTHFHSVFEDDGENAATAPDYVTTRQFPPNPPPIYSGPSPSTLEFQPRFPGIHSPTTPPSGIPPQQIGLSQEGIELRELRIAELEEENRLLHQKVQYFETSTGTITGPVTSSKIADRSNPHVPILAENPPELTSEVDRLKEELKQLKINSGQQFLQLYSKIREKDELLSQMQVEKRQYELLAQMNLERLQAELQQQMTNEDQSEDGKFNRSAITERL